jgi:hypothetical protein
VLAAGHNSWEQQAQLLPSTGSDDDYFGRSVAIYQDTIVVGSIFHVFGDEESFNNAGAVYVYERTG